MKPDTFKTPVTILTGLGIPTPVNSVLQAYQILMDWPLAARDRAHSIATNACLAALNGHIEAETAKANGTCIGQSRMVSPEATAPVVSNDLTGKTAIVLREKDRKSKKLVNLICLYDKKSGKASIAEYQWLGQ